MMMTVPNEPPLSSRPMKARARPLPGCEAGRKGGAGCHKMRVDALSEVLAHCCRSHGAWSSAAP